LARKLLIALWRLVREGVVPDGVILRPAQWSDADGTQQFWPTPPDCDGSPMTVRGGGVTARQHARNHMFGKVRAKVEHVFRVVKCQFGYRKVRYRGIAKNGAQVFSLLALANLYLARRTLASAWRHQAIRSRPPLWLAALKEKRSPKPQTIASPRWSELP
jgi:hypothetical protein